MENIINNDFTKVVDQINLFENLKEDFYIKLRLELIAKFEKMDLDIRNSLERKKAGWVVNGLVKRQLNTSIGLIIFWRTKFGRWNSIENKMEYKCLLDDKIQLQKYKKISHELKYKILTQMIAAHRAKSIIKMYEPANLHKSSISRLLSNIDTFNLMNLNFDSNYKIPKCVEKYKSIYISTDDTFLKLKNKEGYADYCIRVISMCLGKNKKPDERNSILTEKRVVYHFFELKKNKSSHVKKTLDLIHEAVEKFYGKKDDWNFVVAGDGANWIKTISENLNSKIVLDKFHLIQKITRIFPNLKKSEVNLEMYKIFREGVLDDPKLLIKNHIDVLIKNKQFPEKMDKLRAFKTYLKNNLKGIEAYKEDWYLGCFTESNIWHYVKSVSKGKNYSLSSFKNILNIRCAAINRIDLIEIWRDIKLNKKIPLLKENLKIYPDFFNPGKEVELPNLKSKVTQTNKAIKLLASNCNTLT